jgi:hypothetical protein
VTAALPIRFNRDSSEIGIEHQNNTPEIGIQKAPLQTVKKNKILIKEELKKNKKVIKEEAKKMNDKLSVLLGDTVNKFS